jgi:hypothetical protein
VQTAAADSFGSADVLVRRSAETGSAARAPGNYAARGERRRT